MRLLSACQSAMILTKQVLTVEHTGMHPFLQLLGAPLQSLYPGTALSQRELPLPRTWPCLRGSPKPQLRRDVKGSSRPSLPRGRLRSTLHLHHNSPSHPASPTPFPRALPRNLPPFKFPSQHLCPGSWTPLHSLTRELWTRYLASPLLSILIHKTETTVVLSMKVLWEWNKLNHSHNKCLLWTIIMSMFSSVGNLSLRNEFMGVLWWSSG